MLRLRCSLPPYPGPDWLVSLRVCLLSGHQLDLGLGLSLPAAELCCYCSLHWCKTRGACCRWFYGIQESSSGPKFFYIIKYCLLEPFIFGLWWNQLQVLLKYHLQSLAHLFQGVLTVCLVGQMTWKHQASYMAWAGTRWRQGGCSPSK